MYGQQLSNLLIRRGHNVRLRYESPLPRERMRYEAVNLSSVRGPTLKLM